MSNSEIPCPSADPVHRPRSVSFVRTDNRGQLTEIINGGDWRAVLFGDMKADAVLGHHYHRETVVYIHLMSGSATVRTVHVVTGNHDGFALSAGMGVELPTMESHAIRFREASSFVMLKSKAYDAERPDTFPFPVDGI